MTDIQAPISIPEPVADLDSLWNTCQALKEAVETIQGIRGSREYALQVDLEEAINVGQQLLAEVRVPGISGLGVWRYRTETSAPPSTGQIRFDDADISSASEFYLHEVNRAGTDVAAFLEIMLQDGDVLYVQDRTNADNHYIIEIASSVDNGSFRTYGIQQVIEEGTEPGQNDEVLLVAA